MSSVIDILERIGTDSLLRHADDGVLGTALTRAKIDPKLRDAILAGDQRELEELLGASTNVCCGLHPPGREDEDDDEEEPAEDEDEDTKSPSVEARRVAAR